MDTAFTENTLRDAMLKLQAIAYVPQYLLRSDANWPKDVPDGTETVTCRAHPFVEWLAKFFPFDPNTYFNVQKFKYRDPIVVDNSVIDMFGDKRPGRKFTLIGAKEQIDEILRSMNNDPTK